MHIGRSATGFWSNTAKTPRKALGEIGGEGRKLAGATAWDGDRFSGPRVVAGLTPDKTRDSRQLRRGIIDEILIVNRDNPIRRQRRDKTLGPPCCLKIEVTSHFEALFAACRPVVSVEAPRQTKRGRWIPA
jgi:hypothetical protein